MSDSTSSSSTSHTAALHASHNDCVHNPPDGLVQQETYEPQGVDVPLKPDANAVKFQRITFLGTGSAIPSPGRRNTSCINITFSNATSLLMDCGEASQHQIMKSTSVRFATLSTILITHLHGDHCFGIFGLLCTIANQGRTEPVLVVGPKGIREMVTTVLRLAGGFAGYTLKFLELEHETTYADLGTINNGVRLAAYPLKHRIASFGYILTEGVKPGALDVATAKRLGVEGKPLGLLKQGKDVTLPDGRVVLSADCVSAPNPPRRVALLQDTYDSDIALPALQGVDLLLHECTYSAALYDKAIEHGHSTSGMVGQFAAKAQAKMVVMTHFSSRYQTRDQTKMAALKAAASNPKSLAAATVAATPIVASSTSSASSVVDESKIHVPEGSIDLQSLKISSSTPSAPAAALVDVLTLDELIAEAEKAYSEAMSDRSLPKYGIHAAEDFLVIDSKQEEFKIRAEKDRVFASELIDQE